MHQPHGGSRSQLGCQPEYKCCANVAYHRSQKSQQRGPTRMLILHPALEGHSRQQERGAVNESEESHAPHLMLRPTSYCDTVMGRSGGSGAVRLLDCIKVSSAAPVESRSKGEASDLWDA